MDQTSNPDPPADSGTAPRRQSQQQQQLRYTRTRHRARQHESAHAQGLEESTPAPGTQIDHPLISREQGELIATDDALAEFVGHLRAERVFAYDSEFIGELTYHPQLCLIQAASSKRIGLIDPMSPEIDLAPFWELLCDPSIEKIVHAGEQDIEPVYRLTSSPAANIFDTQIASGFVGLAYPIGLSKLVGELVGARLGKGLTFTHWDQRPLSAQQLRYAADDVRFLPAIHAIILERLEALGHTAWARAECDALCDPTRYGFHPEDHYLKVRGSGALPPAGLAVLRELTIWRDAAAREADVPARAFLKDEILVDMSRQPVKCVEKLNRVKGLPRPIEADHGKSIVAVTLKALELPASERPTSRNVEPTPTERFQAESLYAAAAAMCAGQSIDPALVASRQEVAELHRALVEGQPVSEMRMMKGWRAKACGEELVKLFNGNTVVRLSWRDGRLSTSD